MVAWALVVGINEYRPQSGLPTLMGAVDDAIDFAEWSLDPYGGGVDAADLYLWTFPPAKAPPAVVAAALAAPPAWGGFTAPDFNRAPRGDEIRTTLYELALKASSAGVDRLYVYFAGHGLQTQPLDFRLPSQVCFLAGDYMPPVITNSLVPGIYTRSMMRRIGPVEVVMFFDCCRSTMPINESDPPVGGAMLANNNINACCAIGLAAEPGGTAYETPRSAPSRGAFTRLLTYGLRNARVNNGLTASELERYLRQGIHRLTSGLAQKPSIDPEPKDYDLTMATGPAVGPDPDMTVDLSGYLAKGDVIVTYPDRARRTLGWREGPYSFTAPIGLYAFETPAHEILHTESHTGPDPTHVVIAP